MRIATTACLIVSILYAASQPANAALSRPLFENTPGSAACQGALPAFAGTLRARPLALQNEGAGNAFVTCAVAGGLSEDNDQRITNSFRVQLANTGDTPRTVTCTLVETQYLVYSPKAVVVPAGGTVGITWLGQEINPQNFNYMIRPAVNCGLPTEIGVSFIQISAQFQT